MSGSRRGLRGGSWFYNYYGNNGRYYLGSTSGLYNGPSLEGDTIGFRVATVPEPSGLVLTIFFSAALCARRKRSMGSSMGLAS